MVYLLKIYTMKNFLFLLSVLLVTVSCEQTAEEYYNIGLDKFETGDHKGAIVDYTKAIELAPAHSRAYCARGEARNWENDIKGAIADYTKAIELAPAYAYAYSLRSEAYLIDLKNYSAAIADLTKLIELGPDYLDNNEPDPDLAFEVDISTYYGNRSQAKSYLKDYKGAISDINKAIELKPKDSRFYRGRGCIKSQLSDYDGACLDWSKAVELGNTDAKELIKLFRGGLNPTCY
jgi:tetratricopeptide (TPR) repeat protein